MNDPVESTSAALGESDDSPAFSMSIALPPGTDVQTVGIAGLKKVTLADRVQIPTVVVSTGSVASGGVVEAGVDSKTGSITSYGRVILRDRARVAGDVTAADTIQKGNSVVVTGACTPNATLGSVVNLAWNVSVPGPNLGQVSLEPDTAKDIAPGRYGVGRVKSRSSLTLHSGDYYFDTLTVEPQGKLLIDDAKGPVRVYLGNSLTYRGEIHPASFGIPRLLVGVRGTGGVVIEAPFTGVVAASQSEIRLQASTPDGHRGVFFGRTVTLGPDTVIAPYAFEWQAVVGGTVNPDIPDTDPHRIIPTAINGTLAVNPAGLGPTTTTSNPGRTVTFTLPTDYSVEGGVIANGTLQMSFTTPTGTTITCTYKGQSSTSVPTTAVDLIMARILKFVSCSDGKPASATRQGTTFTTTVTPAPGLPVTVATPMREVGACHEKVEIISALETYQLRKNFKWSSVTTVGETDPAGNPALYYAWAYVRSRDDLLNLKKLWIHVLSRPLFTDELDVLAGKCGSFVNPGDGEGFMVPVVILGKTYNRLKQVQSRNDISGDKVVLDAVVLRTVPAAARNSNGSIKLDALKKAHFVYLPYEKRPLPASSSIVFELWPGGSKALLGAVEWIAGEVKSASEMCTRVLGHIDRWANGTTTVVLQISAITQDPAFTSTAVPFPVMMRAWGDAARQKLGAPNLKVSVLQKFFGSIVPETSVGRTGPNGNVWIDAATGTATRGATGLCIELANDAAKVVGDSIFFLPEEVCDFRAFNANDPGGSNTPADFKLRITPVPQAIHIENTLLAGLYQADDVYRYGQRVVGISPKQARIITGYWAETISPGLDDGRKNVNTLCLNYPNAFSDAALAAGVLAGTLAGSLTGPITSILGGLKASYIAMHIGNADILMPVNSRIPFKRAVMSHEMGHYMFCSMLQERNSNAENWLILSTISNHDFDGPVRYLNEAVAEYFTGQVAGAADYGWALMPDADFDKSPGEDGFSYFCAPQNGTGQDTISRCWEANITAVASGAEDPNSIGRIVTMLYDAADDPNEPRDSLGVQRGDAWAWTAKTPNSFPLVHSLQSYLKPDFETVTMGGSGIRTFSHLIADAMVGFSGLDEAISLLASTSLGSPTLGQLAQQVSALIATSVSTDTFIYRALNDTIRSPQHGAYNWCDRCSVLATHKRGGTAETGWTEQLFKDCRDYSALSSALDESPPEPALNINRTSCTACPAGTVRNADYTDCVVCDKVVVGDKCEACAPDVTIDALTLAPGFVQNFPSTTPQVDGGACANILWVEIANVGAYLAQHPDSPLSAYLVWPSVPETAQADCVRMHTLYEATQSISDSGTDSFVYSKKEANGVWTPCDPDAAVCLHQCLGVPNETLQSAGNTVTTLRVGIPVGGADSLTVSTAGPVL